MAKESEPCAVSMLRDYLRIPTAHPNPDYSGVVEFMRKVAQKYDFLFDVQEVGATAIVCVIIANRQNVNVS